MNNSAHNGHNFIWRLLHWGETQRHTDETPVVQPTNVLPFQIIHQDTARRLQNRFLQWCDEQAVLNPRLVEQTQPKLRERAGHIQEVTPQVVPYRPRTTDGMRPVAAPNTPIPAAHKQAEQVQALSPANLPPWLQNLRDNSLPVQRQQSAEQVPSVPLPSFIESKPAELMTLRQPSIPLPPFFSDPDVVPDLPTEKRQPGAWPYQLLPEYERSDDGPALPPDVAGQQEPFPEQSWLNGAMDAPTLVPLDEDASSASDRWTIQPWTSEPSSGLGPMPEPEPWPNRQLAELDVSRGILLEIPEEAMKPDLTDEDPDGTAQASALWKLRHCERVKGLE